MERYILSLLVLLNHRWFIWSAGNLYSNIVQEDLNLRLFVLQDKNAQSLTILGSFIWRTCLRIYLIKFHILLRVEYPGFYSLCFLSCLDTSALVSRSILFSSYYVVNMLSVSESASA